jgi:hypothetical protein
VGRRRRHRERSNKRSSAKILLAFERAAARRAPGRMKLPNASSSRARRVASMLLAGALVACALFAHAARHWLYVPLPKAEAELTASTPALGGAEGPLAMFTLPASERMRFEGRVVGRLEAGSYVYLELERASGEHVWVVTLRSSSGGAVGITSASVVAVGYAPQFASKRLGRTFDGLYFAVVRPS